jgi:4-amino-4-deoxy-L-arabinose transferase-like glycosyltransferase
MVSKEKLTKIIHKFHLPTWLCIILAVALILRIPSFFEPYSYGDEMIYLTLGEAVRQGKTLYLFAHDNKPPLLYLTAALAGNLFWFKAILAFWALATVVVFWRFVEALFPKKENLQKVATTIFALLTTLPLLEGNIANAELFMIGPTIGALLILWTKKLSTKNLLTAGVLFSVSTLFKVPAAFDLPVIIFFWLIVGGLKLKNIKEVIKRTIFIAIGYLIPILLTFGWYFMKGAFSQYLVAAYLQNVGYLSSFRPEDVRDPFFVRNGPLLLRFFLVLFGSFLIWLFRKKLSKQYIFLSLWILFSLFAVTLSERPYPHYLIQSVPAISVLFAMLFTLDNIEQSLVIFPLALTLIPPVYYNFWHYKTLPYYQKFVNFALGNTSHEEYLKSFGGHIPPSYEIADFVIQSTSKDDSIFVWGSNSSLIYALSRRLPPIKYVAQYHINDFSSNKEVITSLENQNPKLIIILDNSPVFRELSDLLRDKYIQVQTVDGSEIWSLISPEVYKKIAR